MTIQITEEPLTPKKRHVTQVFKAGATTGVYIPKPIAAQFGIDKAGTHVLIEAAECFVTIRNVEDRLI